MSGLGTLVLSQQDADNIHQCFGLGNSTPLRISFIPGPGDVVGTFRYWRAGRHDPRVPVITYSAMFYDFVEALGAQAQVITPHDPTDLGTTKNIQFVQAERRFGQGRGKYYLAQRYYIRRVKEAVAEFGPHLIIISTDFPSAGWGVLARHGALVLSAHNTFFPMGMVLSTWKNRLKAFVLRRRIRSLSDAVCTSHECRRQIYELSEGRINGRVEYPQLLERYPAKVSQEPNTLLFLGRIERSKGVFMLIDVVARMTAKYSGLKLVLAGSGRDEAALQSRIDALNLPNISFVGQLSSNDVHAAIANSDLVVCPTMTSFNEGLLLVAFEAAAHGVPAVLSSTVPAAESLSAASVVFEADNDAALEAALVHVLDNPSYYRTLAKAAYETRDALYNRTQSWGSQLGIVSQRLEADRSR